MRDEIRKRRKKNVGREGKIKKSKCKVKLKWKINRRKRKKRGKAKRTQKKTGVLPNSSISKNLKGNET